MKGKIFTRDEATRMLPLVRSIVRDAKAAARLIDRQERALAESARRRPSTGKASVRVGAADAAVNEKLRRLRGLAATLEAELEALGWFLVDAQVGVAKCYSVGQSGFIYLAWRLGESAVDHWFPLKKSHLDRRPFGGETTVAENQEER